LEQVDAVLEQVIEGVILALLVLVPFEQLLPMRAAQKTFRD